MPISMNEANFSDIDVPVVADLVDDIATRETGFSISVLDAPLQSLTTDQSPADLLNEAIEGNLYFNIHTSDVPSGEILGHLIGQSDEMEDGVRTITLQTQLDSAQEPGDPSDSDATGTGEVVITVDGEAVSDTSTLTVNGIDPAEVIGGRVTVWKSSVLAAMADVFPKYYSQKSHCNKIYGKNIYCNN